MRSRVPASLTRPSRDLTERLIGGGLMWRLLLAAMVFRGTAALSVASGSAAASSASLTSSLVRASRPSFVCAPMVQQSELAFRLLCRRHGVDVAYTPMLYAKHFGADDRHGLAYRRDNWDGGDAREEAANLVVQFATDDCERLVSAARWVEASGASVAAVDLNFGCPQRIARKGNYGAFLLTRPELCADLVGSVARAPDVSLAVTAKIRLLPDMRDTLDLVLRLQDAGASALTVHGRTREQNKALSGAADWDAIAEVVAAVDVPVVANGGVGSYADALALAEHTGAAGVMSSEALLEDPALFSGGAGVHGMLAGGSLSPAAQAFRQLDLATEYMDLADEVGVTSPAPNSVIKGHLFKMLHRLLAAPPNHDARDRLATVWEREDMRAILADLRRRYEALVSAGREEDASIVGGSWYMRHRRGEEGAG